MGSRYTDNNKDTKFWLEFQVCSDGLEPDEAQAAAGGVSTGGSRGSSAPLKAFSCFGDLPTELRLKIWGYLIRPRIVIAACLDSVHAEEKRRQLAERPKRRAVPALLHVCQEARELGLRHYELAFSWKIPHMLLSPSSSSSSGGSSRGEEATRSEAKVWFNFGLDTLVLLGELEPYDAYGFNSPMVYFLRRDDTRRVRHVACAFEALRYGEHDAEQIFGCLFHVLDRFPLARRLLITSTPGDVRAQPLVTPPPPPLQSQSLHQRDNVIQKIWWGWINGTSVITSSLADTQILMVREADLALFIAEQG